MEQNTTNKPLRRVGTLTLGVCLIAAGTLFLLARFLPGLPWLVIWQVLPAAGLILLGCEVLYYSARPGACRCDFGSVVLCLLLLIPGNMLIHHIAGDVNVVASLPPQAALILIVLATLLTMLGGLIPARSAAKSNPVKALRSE